MSFSTPTALILLLALLPVWYVGWPRQRFRRRRDYSSLLLRTLIMLLLVLALAGVQLVQAVDRLAVVFLVDVSDSMGSPARDAQIEYIRQALAAKAPEDEAAIVLFGAHPVVERSFSAVTEVREFQSTPITTHTDIAAAIQMGLSMFPADATRRIVLLSDGLATRGDTEARARLAAAFGVEISYVYFYTEPAPDVRIVQLDAPARITENQQFDLSVTVEADMDTPATLRLFSGGQMILQQDVSLRTGSNSFTLTQTGTSSGFLDFFAQIVVPAENDGFRQNNQLATFSQVVGPPRVLLVAQDEQETVHLLPALQELGIVVDVVPPGLLPISMAALASYRSVIIANVPATRLTELQMNLIDSYVRDLGGGLIFIGGPQSYGPGGYFQTPLERTLPVEMQIRDQQRLPQLTIAYLIDRSGSMGIPGPSGVPLIELAKEAIIRSLDFLQPTDRAGVASFDISGTWIAPFQDVLDKRQLQIEVGRLRAGGGTDIMAGMLFIEPAIRSEPSERKHIILLTDGGANPARLVELAEDLNLRSGVTTSVIAIGLNIPSFMEEMARAGGGNFHLVEDVQQIPTIFTAETVLATRSYILEQPFVPTLTALNPIMDGIDALPRLLGYVAATPKTAAQVVLRAPDPYGDPLLTVWQYGLGRAAAFTSDATARWAAEWVTWPDFSRFWGQMVSWTITGSTDSSIETRITMEGDRARISVDARAPAGGFLNGLDLQASVLDPAGRAEVVPLVQVGPGRYEALFTPGGEGAYFLTVSGGGQVEGQETRFNEINGWVMSYSPEYLPAPGDARLLARLAEITGGRDMSDEPQAAFTRNLAPRMAAAPVWPWLLLAAVLLLPLDVALRRVIITRNDLLRLRRALFARGPEDALRPSERITSLLDVRDRARSRTGYGKEDETSTAAALLGRKQERPQPPDQHPAPPPAAPAAPSRRRAPPVQHQPAEDDKQNIGARLLRRRRRDDEE